MHILVITGGASSEHDISLSSSKGVVQSLLRHGLQVSLLFIDRANRFWMTNKKDAVLLFYQNHSLEDFEPFFFSFNQPSLLDDIDVIFPVAHGKFVEDGHLQGLLGLVDIPVVGTSCEGSAVTYNKQITYDLIRGAHPDLCIPLLHSISMHQVNYTDFESLCYPVIVKPAKSGSSIGLSYVENPTEMQKALDEAFVYSDVALVEKYVKGFDLWVGLIRRHGQWVISKPGAIITEAAVYDYHRKYIKSEDTEYIIPYPTSNSLSDRLQKASIAIANSTYLGDYGRIDYMYDPDQDQFYLIDVNTIPGFTPYSILPMLFEADGMSYDQLILNLVNEAASRSSFEARQSNLEKITLS